MRQFQPSDRLLAIRASAFGAVFEPFSPQALFETIGPLAIVDVRGPIVHEPDPKKECQDHGMIVRSARAAALSQARAIVLRVDSPGGDALGMVECSRELRAIAQESGKPLVGLVIGQACSAAYALLTAASKVVVDDVSTVGSIGVYKPRLNATVADASQGLSWEFISSGDAKLDGNPHTVPTDAERIRTKASVLEMTDVFYSLVSEMRPGVSTEKLRAWGGCTFQGRSAVKEGLADIVGSLSDVLAMFAGAQQATAPAAATEKAMAEETTKEDSKGKARKAFFSAMEHAFNAAFGDEEEKKEEPKKEEPKKEEGKTSAASEEPKKEEKDDEPAAKAQSLAFSTAERMAKLEAKLAAKEDAEARGVLLAKRPDFTAEVLALLADLPLAKVSEAVEKFPRIGPPRIKAVAMPVGTRGETQVGAEGTGLDEETKSRISARFGGSAPLVASKYEGGVQTLEFATPEQARARLVELAKAKVGS